VEAPLDEAPTGNHLFWRPNPFSEEKDAHVHPYVRTNEKGQKLVKMRGKQYLIGPDGKFILNEAQDEELAKRKTRDGQPGELTRPGFNQAGRLSYVPVSGYDVLALKPDSQYKYRIPNDSVVNKVGDCKLCLCFGWRLTAAQWSARGPLEPPNRVRHSTPQPPPPPRSLVAQPALLHRAHHHGLRHLPLRLLAAQAPQRRRLRHALRHRAHDGPHLPLLGHPDADDDRQQPDDVEQRVAQRELQQDRVLPARQRPAGARPRPRPAARASG
jgi:hypothetical protein